MGVNTWSAGREHCTAASHVHADIWRVVFDKADDLGRVSFIVVRKVRDHATARDIANGKSTEIDQAGNNAAHEAAKAGQTHAPVQ